MERERERDCYHVLDIYLVPHITYYSLSMCTLLSEKKKRKKDKVIDSVNISNFFVLSFILSLSSLSPLLPLSSSFFFVSFYPPSLLGGSFLSLCVCACGCLHSWRDESSSIRRQRLPC